MADLKSKSSTNEIVVVDDGYALTKVVTEDGACIKIASLVRQGAVLGQASDAVHSYRADGLIFTTTGDSDNAAGETRFDGYPFSAENRVMIHHALRLAGKGGKEVRIATSLPVADFYEGNGVNVDACERKTANVLKPVESVSGAKCASIVSNRVLAEGVSAWCDFALSDTGEFRQKLKKSAAVVDIGGRTTDTVKVLAELAIEKRASGTCDVGVLRIFDELASAMAAHPEVRKTVPNLKAAAIPRQSVEKVLLTGRLTEFGMDIDMSAEVKEAKRVVAALILRDVESRLATGFDLEYLLIVGGGAALLKEEIQARYKQAEFLDNPEFANARGMMKLMKFAY